MNVEFMAVLCTETASRQIARKIAVLKPVARLRLFAHKDGLQKISTLLLLLACKEQEPSDRQMMETLFAT